MDILKMIYEGEITESEAYDVFDKAVHHFHTVDSSKDFYDVLNLDQHERTGMIRCDLSQIAKWRYEGWPERCAQCGGKMPKEKFGWMCMKEEEGGGLAHISCDEDYLRQIGYTEEEIADKN